MASLGEDVYATLLLNDFYLPGALVLAHSLRDAGTTKRLAVLVTSDSVSRDVIAQLEHIFDYIIPVERITNQTPANLYLMNRADLHSTFTKIVLWKQTQFRKIVYMDADMVALRAPDELFNLSQPFSAAPDIGWPDLFNTGLMVLTPNMGDYYALLAMAQRGISFDGADQGLLNMHFKNTFNRISFTYNVTPSAHYQYLPAYKHFQSSISAGHFIGPNKPWNQGREASQGSTPYDEMVGRWWSVYDRHYRESSAEKPNVAPIIQYHTKGEFHPEAHKEEIPVVPEQQTEETSKSEITYPANERPHEIPHGIPQEVQPQEVQPQEVRPQEEETHEAVEIVNDFERDKVEVEEAHIQPAEPPVEREEEKEPQWKPTYSTWDASRAPPPSDSKPEAHSFPATHYTMSSDPTPFKAPERYPDPPKDMYYEVPKTPTYQKPAPIFPWEKTAAKPSRVFPEDLQIDLDNLDRPSTSGSGDATVDDEKASPATPTTPTVQVAPADPWQSFTSKNAWDDIPEIERYIGNLQKNRKGNIQVLQGYGSVMERPSLPVTPAPIRRPSFWGEERNEEGELPAAEGVPSQEEWDPAARLEQLARRQSDVLANKLGQLGGEAREIPMRPLPYGSEGVISPTYVAPTAPSSSEDNTGLAPSANIEEPSYKGPSAAWEKNEDYTILETPLPPSEEEKDVLET
ncbi:nucleotide-diphospho-sugar transferase [Bisporella sp. PMI_857]|nr:nucleotide-diphospho-sugar transferase [Bisporella sp. PMI_857]